jgi:hypothetical protein
MYLRFTKLLLLPMFLICSRGFCPSIQPLFMVVLCFQNFFYHPCFWFVPEVFVRPSSHFSWWCFVSKTIPYTI